MPMMTATPYKFVKTKASITIYLPDGERLQSHRNSTNWNNVLEALEGRAAEDVLRALCAPETVIRNMIAGSRARIENGEVFYDDERLNGALVEKVVDIFTAGQDALPWLKFLEKVYTNPADWSRQELYLFLEKCRLPITPNGDFLAYKSIRYDYKDHHSGTMDNSVGQIVQMPREEVDPRRNNTCSRGLHFCSRGYVGTMGSGRLMVVQVNPADVVSIPSDYGNTKGRAWRYRVVGEIGHGEMDDIEKMPVMDDYDPKHDETGKVTPEPAIDSKHGRITRSYLSELIKEHGSQRSVARALGIPAGTVSSWAQKLQPT